MPVFGLLNTRDMLRVGGGSCDGAGSECWTRQDLRLLQFETDFCQFSLLFVHEKCEG